MRGGVEGMLGGPREGTGTVGGKQRTAFMEVRKWGHGWGGQFRLGPSFTGMLSGVEVE